MDHKEYDVMEFAKLDWFDKRTGSSSSCCLGVFARDKDQSVEVEGQKVNCHFNFNYSSSRRLEL